MWGTATARLAGASRDVARPGTELLCACTPLSVPSQAPFSRPMPNDQAPTLKSKPEFELAKARWFALGPLDFIGHCFSRHLVPCVAFRQRPRPQVPVRPCVDALWRGVVQSGALQISQLAFHRSVCVHLRPGAFGHGHLRRCVLFRWSRTLLFGNARARKSRFVRAPTLRRQSDCVGNQCAASQKRPTAGPAWPVCMPTPPLNGPWMQARNSLSGAAASRQQCEQSKPRATVLAALGMLGALGLIISGDWAYTQNTSEIGRRSPWLAFATLRKRTIRASTLPG